MAHVTNEDIAFAAQNDEAMTELAHKYNLFIIRTASATCRRFVTKHDDEYAIALRAFCDAVQKFDPDAEVSFDSYAKLLIKNRVIDYLRTESRHTGHLSLEDEMENGRDFSDDADREQAENQSAAAAEIVRLSAVIGAYGITFGVPEASKDKRSLRFGRILPAEAPRTGKGNEEKSSPAYENSARKMRYTPKNPGAPS